MLKAPANTPSSTPVVLDLSGPVLTTCLERLAASSEADGGIERYVAALRFRSRLFGEALAPEPVQKLESATFRRLCAFLSTVRRRVGPALEGEGFIGLRDAISELLENAKETSSADSRIKRFCQHFPGDRNHRWVRDLAAELLHGLHPELYPLMCRWVWDAKTNTGVIRELWHGENMDQKRIDVADNYETFLMLRQELSQFLKDNGVFRDTVYYVDLLIAQVYANYISNQGGTYLRTDFSEPEDSMHFVRRLLGLDAVNARNHRTRFKASDGTRDHIDATPETSLLFPEGTA